MLEIPEPTEGRIRQFRRRIAAWERRHGLKRSSPRVAGRLAARAAVREWKWLRQCQRQRGRLELQSCRDCGRKERIVRSLCNRGRYCPLCGVLREHHRGRLAQARRRARLKEGRGRAAGLSLVAGRASPSAWAPIPCRHCGVKFAPQRCTARYCSTRCRVAAWRLGR
jgi:hypothetical protein